VQYTPFTSSSAGIEPFQIVPIVIAVLVLVAVVVGAGLGLLIYLIKRK
jgi:phage shock protein PspC (stress-responsive transcriptional regulator)